MSRLAFTLLLMLIFVIPFENMLVFDGFGTISRIIGFAAFAFGFFSLLADKKNIVCNRFQVIFFIFILFSITSSLWTLDIDASLKSIYSLTQLFLFVWLIFEFSREKSKQVKLLIAYVLGCYVSSIATIWSFLLKSDTVYLRYSAKGFDPNDLGIILAIGVPMAWYVSMKTKNILFILLLRLYVPISLFSIILTSSRTAFIAFIFSSFFIIIANYSTKFTTKLSIIFISTCIAIYSIDLLPEFSIKRISSISDSVSSGTLNGRVDIWKDYFYIFLNDPFFGVGIGASQEALLRKTGSLFSTHNLFLAIIIGCGLFGFLIFMGLIFDVIKNLFELEELDFKLWLIISIVWLVGVMTLSWEYKKTTWLIFSMIISARQQNLWTRKLLCQEDN